MERLEVRRTLGHIGAIITMGLVQQIGIDYSEKCIVMPDLSRRPALKIESVIVPEDLRVAILIRSAADPNFGGRFAYSDRDILFPELRGEIPELILRNGEGYIIELGEITSIDVKKRQIDLSNIIYSEEFQAPFCNSLRQTV